MNAPLNVRGFTMKQQSETASAASQRGPQWRMVALNVAIGAAWAVGVLALAAVFAWGFGK